MTTHFHYWARTKGGPKQGVLVFQEGYLEFDLNNNISKNAAQQRLGDAIGEVWKVPADNTYTAEGTYKNRSIYSNKHLTIEAAVETYRKIIQQEIQKEQHLDANPLLRLAEELSCHDWHYHYSDDHSVWTSGQAHWNKLYKLMQQVDVDAARQLFAKHAPKDFTCPV